MRPPFALLTYAHYAHLITPVNFTGGKSLNLGETIAMLDEYQRNHPDEQVYPPGVRKAAKELDGTGSPLTLIDAHKDVFEYIKRNEDPDKIKERYSPLFDEVKPAHDVYGRSDSLLERLKSGEFETFNPKNELSVDLLRLLYAEGFSTTDLKQYTGGVDIYHTAKKLNIPLLNPHYAHVLKLSDLDFNERIAREIQKTKMARRGELEPYIPKHKPGKQESEIIGTELTDYFAENPENVYSQKEDQQRFYAEHPEIAAKLTDLILIIWGEDDKKTGLTRRMKKHFEASGVKDIQAKDLDPFEITPENAEILKNFLEKNKKWAPKAFSDRLKALRAKEIPERIPRTASDGYLFKTFPGGLVIDFIDWKKEKGIFEQGFYNQFMEHDGSLKDSAKYKATYEYLGRFFKGLNNVNAAIMCEANLRTVKDFQNALDDGEVEDTLDLESDIFAFFGSVSGPRYDEETGSMREHVKPNEIARFYQSIIKTYITNGHKVGAKKALDFLYKRLDENYEAVKAEAAALPKPKANAPQSAGLPKPAPGTTYVDFSTIPRTEGRSLKFHPKELLTRVDAWKKQKGITETTYHNLIMNKDGRYLVNLGTTDNTNQIMTDFYRSNVEVSSLMADVYLNSVQDLYSHIVSRYGGSFASAEAKIKNPDVLKILRIFNDLNSLLLKPRTDNETGKYHAHVKTQEAYEAYKEVLEIIIKNDLGEYYKFLISGLSAKYSKLQKNYRISF